MHSTAKLPQSILCPVDFSPGSETALSHALRLGEAFSAKVLVMHVVPALDDIVEYGLLSSAAPDLTTGMRTATEERLREVEGRLRELVERVAGPKNGLDVLACFGDAAPTICSEAESRAIDLIVISTRGLTGLKRMLLGSTAEHVVRTAPCPVWTTHPDPATAG